MATVYTRFAPSPTGHLHVGGARTALFCWAFAQRAKLNGDDGRFLIRIEDTDQARSSDESARGILEDLAWLGITWDEGPVLAREGATIGGDPRGVGPFFQARRVALYNKYVEQLIGAGRAYPAFETPEEIDALRKAAAAAKQTYRYDRSRVPMEERLRRLKAGEPHAVRFVAPDAAVTVHDQVLGDVSYAAGEMDDFVIRKADGFPTYHFAVVVDDETMGVTHVLRAQEHLNNTPRHVALQAALAFRTPAYAHMPLIFNQDGTKMGKRDRDKAARRLYREKFKELPPSADNLAWLMERWVGSLDLAESTKDQRMSIVGQAIDYQASHLSGQLFDEPAERIAEIVWKDLSESSQVVYASHIRKFQKLLAAVQVGKFGKWLANEKEQLGVEYVDSLADAMDYPLPEIDVSHFRAAGYLPEALVNFLSLLGWNPGTKTADGKDVEKFDADFIARNFSLDRIGKGNAKFDRAKLLSFNADRIGAMTDAEFIARWRAWAAEFEPALAAKLTDRQLSLIAPAARPRCKTLRDLAGVVRFAVTPDDGFDYDPKAVEKVLRKGEPSGLAVLKEARGLLAGVEAFEPGPLHAAIEGLAQQRGVGMGQVAQPLRVALTGSTVSPPLGETLAVLGREASLARIDRCLHAHGG